MFTKFFGLVFSLSIFLSCSSYSIYKSQAEVDEIVIKTALMVYKKINDNWKYVEKASNKPATESDLWKVKIYERGDLTLSLFEPKEGAKIAEALDDIVNKSAIAECRLAFTIVRLHCLKSLLGDKFDNLFQVAKKEQTNSTPFIHALSWKFQKQDLEKDKYVGSTTILNIPEYVEFKPLGASQASNVMSIGNKSFIGFDGGLFVSGAKEESEIEDSLYKSFIDEKDVKADKNNNHKNSPYQNKEEFLKWRRETQKKAFLYYFDVNDINTFMEK